MPPRKVNKLLGSSPGIAGLPLGICIPLLAGVIAGGAAWLWFRASAMVGFGVFAFVSITSFVLFYPHPWKFRDSLGVAPFWIRSTQPYTPFRVSYGQPSQRNQKHRRKARKTHRRAPRS